MSFLQKIRSYFFPRQIPWGLRINLLQLGVTKFSRNPSTILLVRQLIREYNNDLPREPDQLLSHIPIILGRTEELTKHTRLDSILYEMVTHSMIIRTEGGWTTIQEVGKQYEIPRGL